MLSENAGDISMLVTRKENMKNHKHINDFRDA
jgi:hypothetical protein